MTARNVHARRRIGLLALLAGLGAVGAFLPVGHAEIDAQPTPNSLEIRGTGAMGQLARAVVEQFMKEHEGTIVTVQTCGARQGLKALIVGTCALAMGTDEVPEDLDKLARDTGVKLARTDVYRDALVVVVNPQNPVRALTLRQLRDIFRGATANWKDVGGPDAPIDVLTPTSTSSGYEVFKRSVLGSDAVMTPKAVQVKGKDLRTSGIPVNGITYVGLAQYVRLNKPEAANNLSDGIGNKTEAKEPGHAKPGKEGKQAKEEVVEGEIQVDCVSPPPAAPAAPSATPATPAASETSAAKLLAQGVAVEGVCPSTATVRSGSYSIVRKMSLYRRDPSPPLAAQIIEHFIDPKKGQDLIRKDGNVPVN